ncbi:DUF2238 domain-containing protein [Floccifex sp.]|uniref:DUF2238 domain-containing protein n=1 Tax=Floccifex sp. TaxID=2815810 RepID=UPI003F09CB90
MNFKKLFHLEIVIYIVFWILGFYRNIIIQNIEGIGMGFVAIFTPLIIPILFKIFHFQPFYEIYSINIAFVFFASLIGSCFQGYKVPYFDKVVHFCSGLFATCLAMMLFYKIKETNYVKDKQDYKIFLLFINAINCSIAVIWEFFEFAMLVFFNNDCIRNHATGVYDSMTDMLCAFIAGLCLTYSVIRYYKRGKSNFFIRTCNTFYELNIRK